MPLSELWERWGRELPIWEAYYEIDPWGPERADEAAWQTAKAQLTGKASRRDFDGSRERKRTMQSVAEAKVEMEKAAAGWAGKA